MTKTVADYVNEINIQKAKPLDEQLNDLKIAGAKLLVSLDKLLKENDTHP